MRRSTTRLPAASIALYAVGAVKQIVTPCSSIRSASSAGVAFSTSSVEAPAWRGKSRTPPSPKVNAYGGVPVKTSSAEGCSTCRENVSQIDSTSRWKCIVAFGRPVVPEVNASMQTSSLEVGTSSNVAGLAATRSGPGVVAERDRRYAERLDRVEEPVVDQRRVEVRDLVDGLQLAGAQQRHRGDQRRRRP